MVTSEVSLTYWLGAYPITALLLVTTLYTQTLGVFSLFKQKQGSNHSQRPYGNLITPKMCPTSKTHSEVVGTGASTQEFWRDMIQPIRGTNRTYQLKKFNTHSLSMAPSQVSFSCPTRATTLLIFMLIILPTIFLWF